MNLEMAIFGNLGFSRKPEVTDKTPMSVLSLVVSEWDFYNTGVINFRFVRLPVFTKSDVFLSLKI